MPDGLYERDVLAWSQHQAELLRRVGRGERVNDVDWGHVAEEIEDVGLSELRAVESFLDLILVHLLRIQADPECDATDHWHDEIDAFQRDARRRFTPSMRQRIDLDSLYSGAVKQLRKADRRKKETAQRPWPDANPVSLDQLLHDDSDDLVNRLSATRPD
jgi:hypothetical protein